MQLHNKLIPIEIKSTATFHPALLKNIRYFQNITKDRSPIGFLLYAGEEAVINNINLVNYINAHGTSTPAGDKAEVMAIDKLFSENSEKIGLSVRFNSSRAASKTRC